MANSSRLQFAEAHPSPQFSILMPSFNQGSFIEEAIHSILLQRDVSLELIIKDNLSCDGTLSIINSISKQDKRVKVISSRDNGPASALNQALEQARGIYIGCLNSDDFYLPNSLQQVARIFESNKEIDIVYGHGFSMDNRKSKLMLSDPFTVNRFKLGIGRVVHQSTFYRRESLLESHIQFNPMNITCWDTELLLDAVHKNLKIEKVKFFFGVMRIHDLSITGSQRLARAYQSDKLRILDGLTNKYTFWSAAGVFARPLNSLLRWVQSKVYSARLPKCMP